MEVCVSIKEYFSVRMVVGREIDVYFLRHCETSVSVVTCTLCIVVVVREFIHEFSHQCLFSSRLPWFHMEVMIV